MNVELEWVQTNRGYMLEWRAELLRDWHVWVRQRGTTLSGGLGNSRGGSITVIEPMAGSKVDAVQHEMGWWLRKLGTAVGQEVGV